MLAYIPYMDPMGYNIRLWGDRTRVAMFALEVKAAATLRQVRGDFPSVGFFFFAGGARGDAKVMNHDDSVLLLISNK